MIRLGWDSKLIDCFTAKALKPLCTKICMLKRSPVKNFSPRNLPKEKPKMYSIELFLKPSTQNYQAFYQPLISTESARRLMLLRNSSSLRVTSNCKTALLTNGSNIKSPQKSEAKRSKRHFPSTKRLKLMKLERLGINSSKKKLLPSWIDDNHQKSKIKTYLNQIHLRENFIFS